MNFLKMGIVVMLMLTVAVTLAGLARIAWYASLAFMAS